MAARDPGFARAPIPAMDGGGAAEKSSNSGSLDRMRALLSQFYGTADEDPAARAAQARDIDSASFAVRDYTAALLRDQPLPELLRRDDKMVQEIKSLDSDMQMLVYENYNKFISATDTIRQMKQRVEEMEARSPNRNPKPKPNPSPLTLIPNTSPRLNHNPNPNTPSR